MIRRNLLYLIGLALIVGACSKDPEPQPVQVDNNLLGYIPADSPYYIVSGERMPQEVIDKVASLYEGMWTAIMDQAMADYREMAEELGAEDGGEVPDALIKDLYKRPPTEGTVDEIVKQAITLVQYEGAMLTLQQYLPNFAAEIKAETQAELAEAQKEEPVKSEISEEEAIKRSSSSRRKERGKKKSE